MTWVFLVARSKHGFVTSDNPVIYTVDNGIQPPAGQLFFPISQNVALFANWASGMTKEFTVADPSLVDDINRHIVRAASDHIFYSGHKNWIAALVKRESKREGHLTPMAASQQS